MNRQELAARRFITSEETVKRGLTLKPPRSVTLQRPIFKIDRETLKVAVIATVSAVLVTAAGLVGYEGSRANDVLNGINTGGTITTPDFTPAPSSFFPNPR